MWKLFSFFSKPKGVNYKGIPNNFPKGNYPFKETKILTNFSEGRAGTNLGNKDTNWIRNTIVADALLSENSEDYKNNVKADTCAPAESVASLSIVSSPVSASVAPASPSGKSSSSSCGSRSRDNDNDDSGGGDSGGSDDWDD